MLQTFLITVTTGFNGATTFAVPDPSPVAAPETGIISFSVGLAGLLRPESLWRFVGRGGWLLAGLGITPQQGATVSASIVNPGSFTTEQQMINTFNLGLDPSYRYRPTYVPAGWRLRFNTANEEPTPAVIRLDVCPLRDHKTAVRAIAATRLFELIPAAV